MSENFETENVAATVQDCKKWLLSKNPDEWLKFFEECCFWRKKTIAYAAFCAMYYGEESFQEEANANGITPGYLLQNFNIHSHP